MEFSQSSYRQPLDLTQTLGVIDMLVFSLSSFPLIKSQPYVKETEFGNTFLPTRLKLFSPYSKNGFLGGSVVKNPPANAGGSGDTDSIPRSGKSPRGGNGNPPQYSCQEYPMNRGTWWAIVHGVTKSQT